VNKNSWEREGKVALLAVLIFHLIPLPHPLDIIKWGAISAFLGAGSVAFARSGRWKWFALSLAILMGQLLYMGFASIR